MARPRGFVRGQDVLAMLVLISLIGLAVLLGREGGGVRWGVVSAAAGGGLLVYAAVYVAARRLHVELGCLLSVPAVAIIVGGGLYAQRVLHARGHAPAEAQWVALAIGAAPFLALTLFFAVLLVWRRARGEQG